MAPRSAADPDREGAVLGEIDGLAQLTFLVQGALARRAAEEGLSLAQVRLGGILRDRRPTMNELATLLELDKSSVTGLVDRAEGRGLVERVASTADRRVVLVKLTAKGRALVSRVASGFAKDVSEMLECLPAADRHALAGLLRQLLVFYAAERGVDLLADGSAAGGGDAEVMA